MNAPNPKKLYGDKKPPLHLLPLAGMVHQSLAHMDGDLKYGFENWNDKAVEKLTYIGAALRHLELYKYGETHTRDTGVHNLGGVMACCAILLDAELNGMLIDNTKHSKATCDLLHNAEVIVEKLKDMQKVRDAAKEQERKDQTWADAANADRSDRFEFLKADALQRIALKNIDGADRRETIELPHFIFDAGGDAPAEPVKRPFVTCGRCKTTTECNNSDYCRA